MEKIKLFNLDGKVAGDLSVESTMIVEAPHNQAMFDQILAENNGVRQGTHSTLTKGEVRGGGKKPVAQKHTGRARQGSTRNPHMVGGGVVFGPKPTRNYKNKVNAKVSKLALKSALTLKINNNAIIGLSNTIDIKKPTTKVIKVLLKELNLLKTKTLLIANDDTTNLIASCKNITNITAKKYNQVSVKDIINTKTIICQETAWKKIMEACK